MKDAIVLLMHQGNSFTRELNALLATRDIAIVAISSLPPDQDVFDRNKPLLDDWVLAERAELAQADIDEAVRTFERRGYRLLAAIATFEGYRLLMADLNRALGTRDAPREALELGLDKFRCRDFLRRAGLSAVECIPLDADADGDPARLDLDPSRRWFVKPVRGAASFGCFILDSARDLDDLPRMRAQMLGDRKLSAIFMGKYGFFAEEYVEGPEFSFELVASGQPRVVCIHEKARVERRRRTTLESMSISPPISLPRDTLLEGARFVCECLTRIGLTEGAYHVEMKYWEAKQRWEIIEVNPRMGGSLINASTERVTGVSMLEMWLRALLLKDDAERAVLHAFIDRVSQLARLDDPAEQRATVFVSKYGEKGRTIESIGYDPAGCAPDLIELHGKPGLTLEDSDRAICVMDALWAVDRQTLAQSVELLERESDARFRISYRE
ncbi:carbamoyl-phosphate synthase L chain, ATP binding domain protein [Burkholderia thailandensis MSMB121]|uniref:ATP-grasp domain-containing protein n=2 Tax=Burkholderia humptydooensis TaxID=430531 RepID=A0A7U4P621_9BURK|nr:MULTISPECIES: ATP-grasp domain-containing protein [Burkholderia]AGK47854.1 carbamoyl-phosphate synthase L chain, ATP binding domain protein [Burkholderia thailandensis MSMB121]ATF34755.1 ATP-grasp domain-containing protein [Burkholderia thailandensis]AJY42298.1 carbamoyl-phosphate synthase L chain, ATP binding domain protein [Burkholderia sp. 2002721687]ALX43635.1 carboxylate--amine ligase [Burkholderia humptydooensis]KST75331.1 carboxylate--amine ligase [Burkholderia humptydooensis]